MTLVDELLEYRQMQHAYKRRGGFVAGDDSDDFDGDGGGGIIPDDEYYNANDPDAAYRQAMDPAGAWLGGAWLSSESAVAIERRIAD